MKFNGLRERKQLFVLFIKKQTNNRIWITLSQFCQASQPTALRALFVCLFF